MSVHIQRRLSGFTLLELLVVVMIISILSTLATTAYLNAQAKSRDSARKSDINAIATAVESYYSVTKTFPGRNGNVNGATTHAGCQDNDGSNYFVYYYMPLAPNNGCNSSTKATTSTYNPADYAPHPNWIPGLSEYINPTPIEKKYKGTLGASTDPYGPLEAAKDTSSTNKTRTYAYRHLDKGYAVYARLEVVDNVDTNIVRTGNVPGSPNLSSGSSWLVTGSPIYMIRR